MTCRQKALNSSRDCADVGDDRAGCCCASEVPDNTGGTTSTAFDTKDDGFVVLVTKGTRRNAPAMENAVPV